jgi:hypothetical protein
MRGDRRGESKNERQQAKKGRHRKEVAVDEVFDVLLFYRREREREREK